MGTNRGTGSESNTVGSLAQTSVQLLPANLQREFLSICNDSAVVVYITIDGTPAVLNKGIRLNANGDRVIFDSYVPSKAINAISVSSSGNKVLVTEG